MYAVGGGTNCWRYSLFPYIKNWQVMLCPSMNAYDISDTSRQGSRNMA